MDWSTFKFIDLFAGIGGIRLGVEHVGGKCVFSSEFDEDACKTYEANFGEHPSGDIDCISRCTTVEYALKVNLDEEYSRDNGQAVIAKLSYNARDAKANLPVPQEFNFKEGCNVVQRLTDLRSSVNRYFDFCKNG